MTDNKAKNPRGAGRKAGVKIVADAARKKSRTLTMDDARWAKFKQLGGAKWLVTKLDEAH
jgi:hypothetical protein